MLAERLTVVSGEPGDTWTNTGAKVLYQLQVNFRRSCAVCIQKAGQIAAWWNVPFHSHCNCINVPVPPGATARPFIDYRAEVAALDPAQQAAVMGRSALQLIDRGVVRWEDVVTRSRIRPLHELVDVGGLSVKAMTKAGVDLRRAQAAWDAVHRPEQLAVRKAQAGRLAELRRLGASEAAINRALSTRLSARAVVVPAEPRPLPVPEPYGPSRATVRNVSTGGEKYLLKQVRGVIGPEATLQDIASIVGATDEAVVEVSAVVDGFEVSVEGDGYRAVRRIFRLNSQFASLPEKVRRQAGLDLGPLRLRNSSLYVDSDRQGQGIGARVFGRQVEAAVRLGVETISTRADGNHDDPHTLGSKVWPRFGYDAPIPAAVSAASAAGTSRGGPMPYPAERLSDLMRTPEGRQWWDRNRVALDVKFDLREGSLSRQTWEAYRVQKVNTAR